MSAVATVTGLAVTGVFAVRVGLGSGSAVMMGLSAATLVVVLWFLGRTAWALVGRDAAVEEERVATGRRRRELEREKFALLRALKELEFDHEMGKISVEDFREIGGQYRARAMRVLRQLDEAGGDYRALIDREIKVRMGSAQAAPVAAAPTSVVPEEGTKAAAEPAAQAGCRGCGTANDADAVFCKKCGRPIHES